MIINYPTGLYSSVLPRGLAAGTVTFLISNQPPPRTNLLFPKIPPGVAVRQRPESPLTPAVRRQDLGQLVYSTSRTSRAALGSDMRQYEVGQLLEFSEQRELRALEPFLAGTSTDLQHDTGLLDYERLGWSPQQQLELSQQAAERYRQLELELEQARGLYSQLQVEIAENQKQLNEIKKALAALDALSGVEQMIVELRQRQQQLQTRRGQAINQANQTSAQASALQTQIRALAQVVR